MDGEEKPLYENKIKEMEQRHASVLEGLRKEISTVQNQYNDLLFKFALQDCSTDIGIVDKMKQLQEQLNDKQRENNELYQQVELLKATNSQHESLMERSLSQIEELASKLETKGTTEQPSERVGSTSSEEVIKVVQEENVHLKEMCALLESKHQLLESEHMTMMQELSDLRVVCAEQKEQLVTLQQQHATLASQSVAQMEMLAKEQECNERTQRELAAREVAMAELVTELQEKESKLQQNEDATKKIQEEHDKMANQMTNLLQQQQQQREEFQNSKQELEQMVDFLYHARDTTTAKHQAEISMLEEAAEQQKQRNHTLQEELQHLQEQLSSHLPQHSLKQTLSEVSQHNEALLEKLQVLEDANKTLTDKCQQHVQLVTKVTEEQEQLQHKLLARQSEVELLGRQLQEKSQKFDALVKNKDQLFIQVEQSEAANTDLHFQIASQQKTIQDLTNLVKEREETISSQQLTIQELKDNLVVLSSLKRETTTLKQQLTEQRIKQDEIMEMLHKETRDLTHQQEEYAELEKKAAALSEENAMLKKDVEQLKLIAKEKSSLENTKLMTKTDPAVVLSTSPKKEQSPLKRNELPSDNGHSPESPSRPCKRQKNDPSVCAVRNEPEEVTSSSPTTTVSPSGSSKGKHRKVVVTFSGFKATSSQYNESMKAELSAKIVSLNGTVKDNAEFDHRITHVVTPPQSRTMKTLAAALTNRWVISPEWIIESAAAGVFLPEEKYGKKYDARCFEGKKFCLAKSFEKENEKKPFKTNSCHTLIEQLGKGSIVDTSAEADYIIISDKDKTPYGGKKTLTWNQLLDMIPGEALETTKKVRFKTDLTTKRKTHND